MPPNVLFVLTDQMRASAMGCAGNPDVRTPTLDRLAGEGARVTAAQTTKPMCSPARGSIVTGQHPHVHRVVYNQLRLPTDGPSMGHAFRDAGYRTGYVGKWHLDVDDGGPGRVPPGPRRQGFTDWHGYNDDGHQHHRGHPRWDGDGDLYWEEGYQPAVQTGVALDLLDRYAAFDAPWLLFVSWGPPHAPFDAPEEYGDLYDPAELDLRPNVPERIFGRPRMDERGVEDVRADLAEYYGTITALDDQLERLLDRLDALDEAEDTVVVFTSDHGEMMGSQGRYHKGTPFQEAMNVPFVVRYPGAVSAGRTSDAVVSLADVLPTLCSLCGVETPAKVQGRDVAAHLRGEAAGPDAAYGQDWRVGDDVPDQEDWGPWGQPYRVLRTRRYSLTVDYTLRTQYLFDLEADPYEQENLAGDPDHADLEADLRDRLFEWAREVDDREFVTRQRYM